MMRVLAMFRSKRLVGLHLAGNAVLLAGAGLWLLLPDARAWQLLLTVLTALLLVACFAWLHSGTLAYAANPEPGAFAAAFRPCARRMAWFLLGTAVLFILMDLVDRWSDAIWPIAGYLYAKTPSHLRPARGELAYVTAIQYGWAVLMWYLLPVLTLPWVTAKVSGNRLRAGFGALANWRYWLVMALTVVMGVWITGLLADWTPGHGLHVEMVSMVLRLLLAYVIAVAAWLVAAGVLGGVISRQPPAAGNEW
jgi:hypothetical protein